MGNFWETILHQGRRAVNSHFAKYGLPFLVLMVGASFATTPFQDVKFEARKKKYHSDLLEQAGYKKANLREEYEKIKAADTSDYQNIRGPRPWEDNTDWLKNREMQERRFEKIRREAEEKRAEKLKLQGTDKPSVTV